MDWRQQNSSDIGSIGDGGLRDSDPVMKILSSNINDISRLNAENTILRQQVSRQNRQIAEYESTVKESVDKIEELEKKTDTLTTKTGELVSDIKNARDKTMEPLAVFVGLFTFVSVGFNIFANIEDTSLWVSLLLIIAGMMVIFASLVIHAGSLATKENDRRWWTGCLIAVGFLVVGLGVVLHVSYVKPEPNGDVNPNPTQNINVKPSDNNENSLDRTEPVNRTGDSNILEQ